MNTLENWLYQPQEREGSYDFSGDFLITIGVQKSLSQKEIFDLYLFIVRLAIKEKNLDSLQVFIHKETGMQLFFIDQLNREMVASGDYSWSDNYCTLLLASEY